MGDTQQTLAMREQDSSDATTFRIDSQPTAMGKCQNVFPKLWRILYDGYWLKENFIKEHWVLDIVEDWQEYSSLYGPNETARTLSPFSSCVVCSTSTLPCFHSVFLLQRQREQQCLWGWETTSPMPSWAWIGPQVLRMVYIVVLLHFLADFL